MCIGQILYGFMIIISIAQRVAHLSRSREIKVRHQQQKWQHILRKSTPPCDHTISGEVNIVDRFYYFNPPPNHIVCII